MFFLLMLFSPYFDSCEDFDYCAKCEANEDVRKRHFDDQHTFVKETL